MLRKVLQPFYTTYALLTFLIGLLITFPFYLLFSIPDNARGRGIIYGVVKMWAYSWLLLNGMVIKRIGKKPRSGRYVIVVNHISYLDSIVLFPALPGYFRPLGKKEFSRIPVLGFLYKQLAIMVDRSNAKSRARSMRMMWRTLRKEADIIVFPEGTFNETGGPLKSFYDGAFRLAIIAQTPILPIVFPDTHERWDYSAWWKLWPGRNRVEYLPVIPVEGMTLRDLESLKNTVYMQMESALRQYHSFEKG